MLGEFASAPSVSSHSNVSNTGECPLCGLEGLGLLDELEAVQRLHGSSAIRGSAPRGSGLLLTICPVDVAAVLGGSVFRDADGKNVKRH